MGRPAAERRRGLALSAAVTALLALRLAAAGPAGPAIPVGLPPVPVPADNPLTPAKIALGEKLFFETALSADGAVSCASCHQPERYFTDAAALSKGAGGQLGERNAGSVLNAAYAGSLLWDGRSVSLEDQARYPITHPKEMNNTPEKVVATLAARPDYPPLFASAFGDEAVTWQRVSQALASFQRTLLTGGSPFDRWMAGDAGALGEPARRGFTLFQGKAGCVQCHTYRPESPFLSDFEFHNTGAGWTDEPDLGRFQVSKERADKGAFRTPSLRNVARTAPYMHDGRMQTLAEVIDFYGRGGTANPFLDERIRPLALTAEEKADLLAFLESLTGEMTYRRQTAP